MGPDVGSVEVLAWQASSEVSYSWLMSYGALGPVCIWRKVDERRQHDGY